MKALRFALLLLLAAGGLSSLFGAHPASFSERPEVIVFRWAPGSAVHNCADVEETVHLTCEHIDWIRDATHKHRWIAICGGR